MSTATLSDGTPNVSIADTLTTDKATDGEPLPSNRHWRKRLGSSLSAAGMDAWSRAPTPGGHTPTPGRSQGLTAVCGRLPVDAVLPVPQFAAILKIALIASDTHRCVAARLTTVHALAPRHCPSAATVR